MGLDLVILLHYMRWQRVSAQKLFQSKIRKESDCTVDPGKRTQGGFVQNHRMNDDAINYTMKNYELPRTVNFEEVINDALFLSVCKICKYVS